MIFGFGLMLINNGCTSSETASSADAEISASPAKPDLVSIKVEIQDLEKAWSEADNARDVNALATFYADNAVSMSANSPMAVGKAAILENIETSMAKRPEGHTVAYDVIDVFGDENLVTEVGKISRMDASGKVISTGKYMAIWENQNGKWVCIRDMSNDDAKEN